MTVGLRIGPRIGRRGRRAWPGATRGRALALVATMLVGATACGAGAGAKAGDDPRMVAASAATTAPRASTTSTTAMATTTTVEPVTAPPATTTPTTTEATTTTVSLPVPAPPPPERAEEPRLELGRIEIPKLGLDLAFFEGITLTTLDRGPGHWPGTAMPGQPGNVVIAGHRVSHSRPFRHIDDLVEGDQVIFTVDGQRSTYEVVGTETVTPETMRIVDQTVEPTATLFACHPPGSTQFRWVTHLRLVTG